MAGRAALPRPDLEAFDRATRLPFRFVVKELVDLLGAKQARIIRWVFHRKGEPMKSRNSSTCSGRNWSPTSPA